MISGGRLAGARQLSSGQAGNGSCRFQIGVHPIGTHGMAEIDGRRGGPELLCKLRVSPVKIPELGCGLARCLDR